MKKWEGKSGNEKGSEGMRLKVIRREENGCETTRKERKILKDGILRYL